MSSWFVLGVLILAIIQPKSCEKDNSNVWRFELNIPQMIQNIKAYTGLSINDAQGTSGKSIGRTGSDHLLNKVVKFEITPPDFKGMFKYLRDLVTKDRRNDDDAYVEMGVSSIKTSNVDYPKDYQKGKLLKLIEFQKRQDAKRNQTVHNYNEAKSF